MLVNMSGNPGPPPVFEYAGWAAGAVVALAALSVGVERLDRMVSQGLDAQVARNLTEPDIGNMLRRHGTRAFAQLVAVCGAVPEIRESVHRQLEACGMPAEARRFALRFGL